MSYVLVAICVLSLAIGQLLFKTVSIHMSSLSSLFFDIDVAKYFFAALALYGISTILWIFALKELSLSKAYPFMALGFFIVPVAAHFVFGEPLSYKHLIGAGFIVLGIVVISVS